MTGPRGIGSPSAACFGPIVRFSGGAEMTAQRLSRHLARVRPRTSPDRMGRPVEPVAARADEQGSAL
ncbi:MAG: hypothetical protein ACRDYB_09955 [Acidimicrobiales bacterium]